MDLDKTINELSHNEKKVLQTLNKLNGKASPKEILKNGDFIQEVEVMNASSWLKSKKLVKIEDHIKTVYALGKEGKIFLKNGGQRMYIPHLFVFCKSSSSIYCTVKLGVVLFISISDCFKTFLRSVLFPTVTALIL